LKKITLTRITPYTRGQVPKKKSLMIESAQIPLGGMKNSSMIESAQTILGGIKENSQSSKVPMQSWGA
jgi:hypothetical protein